MKHKRLFKFLSTIENAIEYTMILVGFMMMSGQCEDLRKTIIVNGTGALLMLLGLLGQKEQAVKRLPKIVKNMNRVNYNTRNRKYNNKGVKNEK